MSVHCEHGFQIQINKSMVFIKAVKLGCIERKWERHDFMGLEYKMLGFMHFALSKAAKCGLQINTNHWHDCYAHQKSELIDI